MSTENLFRFESYQCIIDFLKFYKNGIILFDPDITGIKNFLLGADGNGKKGRDFIQ